MSVDCLREDRQRLVLLSMHAVLCNNSQGLNDLVGDTVACLSKADIENVFFSGRKWQGVEIYFSLNSRGWFGFVFSIQ